MKLLEIATILITMVLIVFAKDQQRFSGINDSTAYVGHFFNYTIPKEAFDIVGPLRFEISEAGQQGLPKWLYFDEASRSFNGVPLAEDMGRIYVSVKSYPTKEKNGQPSTTRDVFSIEVVESGDSLCRPIGDVGMIVSIVVNVKASALDSIDRVNLLMSASNFLNSNIENVELAEISEQESALDPKAIRAGTGDAKRRDPDSSLLQFPVGCSGKLTPEDESFLTLIEKSAADRTLSDAIGYRIVGWQVIETSARRQKRYVTPCRGTPIPWVRATLFPIVTERFFESTSEAAPESHIVPTMVSPDFIPPTHPHRHHHGQEIPIRREKFSRPTDIVATPTWKYHVLSTAHQVGGTVMPTPAVFPERATAIYPSRIFIEDPTVTLMPSAGLTSDVISRWYDATTDYTTVDIIATRTRITVEATKILPQSPNFKPTVNNRMKKLSLVCGKVWSYTIPSDTFFDLEDGNTRALKLMFTTSERTSIPASSWIQFDPENQILYALPLSDNIGRHEYVLEAMDKEGATTFDRVELHVWPHPSNGTMSHSFSMIVRYNKWQYLVGIDWQIEILNRLALFFGDADNSKMVVLGVTLDPVRITWANDSLSSKICPVEEIRSIFDAIATPDHQPSKDMKKLMLQEFRVQELIVSYKGVCEGVVTSPMPPPNFSPKIRIPIRKLNVTVGDVLRYRIPEDTFYDFEDGSTRKLMLSLLGTDDLRLPKTSWMQFDPRGQELYGIPIDENIGRHQYKLAATDADGHTVTDPLEIQVHRLPHRKKPPVEFSVHIDHDFDDFISDAAKKSLVAFKLAHLYGDDGPDNILVRSISRGSVVYAWSNKTIPQDQCPNQLISLLVSYIKRQDGSPSHDLIQVMEPEFRVTQANVVGSGVCLKIVPTIVTITTMVTPPSAVTREPDTTVKTVSTTDDIFLTTVLPAAVICAILLVAAIVAYCLYWKKRKGYDKAAGLGVEKEFVGGGVPVVFAGELEEQKSDLGKAPAIMPNEKPPLSTDYLLTPFRRGAAAVRETMGTQQQHHPHEQTLINQQMHHHHHQQQQQHHHHHSEQHHPSEKLRERRQPRREQGTEAVLYEPPPPFAHGREPKSSRQRSSTASYSRHPTYVPP